MSDRLVAMASTAAISFPDFLAATVAVILSAAELKWFPALSMARATSFGDMLQSFTLPVLTLCLGVVAQLSRIPRAALVDVLDISRTADTFISIPQLLFALGIVAALGSSLPVLVGVIAFSYVPGSFWIARSLAMNVNAMEFIQVARAPFLAKVGAFKRETRLPVFHALRIPDVASARHAIADGLQDMVAMTRAHIGDPQIVNKLVRGEEERILPIVGGITITQATLTAVLTDMVGSLHRNGLTRVIVMNGHGSNVGPIAEVARTLHERDGTVLSSLYLWPIAYGMLPRILGAGAAAKVSGTVPTR